MSFSARVRGILLATIFAIGVITAGQAAETPPRDAAGLANIQMVTDTDAIQPGQTLMVGLLLKPEPGHHTYWKSPGIVGIGTTQIWSLPPGVNAGPTYWPPPKRISMAGITAFGYPEEVLLLTEIKVPSDYPEESLDLKLRVGWMACSAQCNPGTADLVLRLPVEAADAPIRRVQQWHQRFSETLALQPAAALAAGNVEVSHRSNTEFDLIIRIPGLPHSTDEEIFFFSYDQQVNSDKPQILTASPEGDTRLLRLTRSDISPKDAKTVTGLLFRSAGWPGLTTSWVEISVPWKTAASEPL
jgi:DsbC/DsbD-like thiol-disulfide interchange protein